MFSDEFQKMIDKYNNEIKEMRQKAKYDPSENAVIKSSSSQVTTQPPNQNNAVIADTSKQTTQQTAENEKATPLAQETQIANQFPFSNTFEYPTIPKEQAIIGQTEGLTGEGKLIVRVFTGREAVPVEDATVIISQLDKNGEKLIATSVTNNAGETKEYSLPTVSSEESLKPGIKNPYAAYKIRAVAEGYYTIDDINVPVFDKQTAYQPIEMIPIPNNFTGDTDLSAVQTGPITL